MNFHVPSTLVHLMQSAGPTLAGLAAVIVVGSFMGTVAVLCKLRGKKKIPAETFISR
jgi:hypothetical protein